MTLSEFKAWFVGFTEDMNGPPSKKQWSRIQGRIGEIDDLPTPAQVIERHYHDYRLYWRQPYPWASNQFVSNGSLSAVQASPQAMSISHQCKGEAMTAMGRADAASVAEA